MSQNHYRQYSVFVFSLDQKVWLEKKTQKTHTQKAEKTYATTFKVCVCLLCPLI